MVAAAAAVSSISIVAVRMRLLWLSIICFVLFMHLYVCFFLLQNIYSALLLCIEHCFTKIKILQFKDIFVYINISIPLVSQSVFYCIIKTSKRKRTLDGCHGKFTFHCLSL